MKLKDTMAGFRQALRALETEIERTLSSETECCGVTVAQCHLLLEAQAHGQANLGELAAALELDKSTLSRTVDGLAQGGLIDRQEDPDNRRKVTIRLTDSGAQKADYINSMCDQAYAKVFTFIPEEKQSLVIEAVSLLATAMKKSRKETIQSCCQKK